MDYKAYALIGILLASVAALATVHAAFAQTPTITVSTDKDSYQAGETVTISGKATPVVSGQQVILQVFNPKGAAYRFDTVTVAADGSYTYPLKVGGNIGITGTYQVKVTYNQQQATTTFQFTSGTSPGNNQTSSQTAQVTLGGQTYQIGYSITGGTLTKLSGDPNTSSLTASITTTSACANTNDCVLTLKIPRTVMDSKDGSDGKSGKDQDFVVFVDSIQGVVMKDDLGATTRTIQIPFEQGTQTVEVVGTFMIPEFGPIAAIILAIAVVGVIVATTKYTNKFNFFTKI